ncbi:hypothetical protein BJX65DRAFT_311069 [Aspergillus insuetus]
MQASPSTRDTWTIKDRQRLLRLRQTFSVLSWRRFHQLRLFPRRSESALATQWSLIQRQRRQLGITDGDDEGDLDAGAADRNGLTMLPRSAHSTVLMNPRSSTKHRNGIVILKLSPRLLAQQLMDQPARASVDQPKPKLSSPRQTETYIPRVDRPWTRAMTNGKRSEQRLENPAQEKGRGQPFTHQEMLQSHLFGLCHGHQRVARYSEAEHLHVLNAQSNARGTNVPFQTNRNHDWCPYPCLCDQVPRAAVSADAHNEREPYTPAPDPTKKNIGETLQRFCSREANKHTELREEIQALQNQSHAIIDRITKLEEQAAKARRNSDRAEMFLQRPDMLLTLDTSRLHSWMRTMDTFEPQDPSTLQTNGDDGHVECDCPG